MGATMEASAAPRIVLLDDRKVIDMKVRRVSHCINLSSCNSMLCSNTEVCMPACVPLPVM
jgi:hypothetical protein